MGLNEDILRFMTIGIDKLEEGPSVMMQTRQERPRSERSERKEMPNDDKFNAKVVSEGE